MMEVTRYIKRTPRDLVVAEKRKVRYFINLFSSVLFFMGLVVLTYQYVSPLQSMASKAVHLRPVPDEYLNQLISSHRDFAFLELQNELEYLEGNYPPEFSLSIPNLELYDLRVETNSHSLSPNEALGHLSGSAYPGRVGKVVIYGHSTIPFLFDSKDYRTVFSRLDKLNTGNLITVDFAGQVYTYIVKSNQISLPQELNLNSFSRNQSNLVLITCYPFGSTEQRLVVVADLVN